MTVPRAARRALGPPRALWRDISSPRALWRDISSPRALWRDISSPRVAGRNDTRIRANRTTRTGAPHPAPINKERTP